MAHSEGKRSLAGLAIARSLKAVGIQPVSGPGVHEAGTYLFRRPDLEGGKLECAQEARKKQGLLAQRETGRQRVDGALNCVRATWGGDTVRSRNTLTFQETGRLVHAVAETKVSLVGRFTFHVHPSVHEQLAASADGWIALVPSEGEHFLLVPFRDIVWPRHVGTSAGEVKWLSMRLQLAVEARWAKYSLPLLG